MELEREQPQGPASGPGLEAPALTTLEADTVPSIQSRSITSRRERWAQASFIWPALLVVLVLSIFPLLVSLYLSLSYLEFVPGGFHIRFVGLDNYRTLILGSGRVQFVGLLKPPAPIGWVVFLAGIGLLLIWLAAAAGAA